MRRSRWFLAFAALLVVAVIVALAFGAPNRSGKIQAGAQPDVPATGFLSRDADAPIDRLSRAGLTTSPAPTPARTTPAAWPAADVTAGHSLTLRPAPREPVALRGFLHGDDATRFRQLQAASTLTAPDRELVQFVADELSDRSLSATTRNHLANLLARWRPQGIDVVGLLRAQADDPREEPLWRDYAVQHVAIAAGDGRYGRADAIEWLLAIADHGSGSQRGTALVHAVRLSTASPAARSRVVARALTLATASAEPLDVRIAALGALGESRDQSVLPTARAIADGERDDALVAAAIACVGAIGSTDDRDWLERIATGDRPLVRSAALGAIARLDHPTKPSP